MIATKIRPNFRRIFVYKERFAIIMHKTVVNIHKIKNIYLCILSIEKNGLA